MQVELKKRVDYAKPWSDKFGNAHAASSDFIVIADMNGKKLEIVISCKFKEQYPILNALADLDIRNRPDDKKKESK